ncbi:MAG TPA: phosphoribosyltransferase family protein [Chlamydiales bacterium]|nr:phosphoribosyltransferase family protein [Chlamydiales bacterium]
MFLNRKDAGVKLAEKLGKYKSAKEGIVIGLPRGGVVVAYEIAKALQLPLNVIIVAKLRAPNNPELAIGALAGKEVFIDQEMVDSLGVSEKYVQEEIERRKKDVERKLKLFAKEPAKFSEKTVIIVDDGMATGSTMHSAVQAIKKEKPKKIVLALPVAPPESLDKFKGLADEIVCLLTPANMYAVGQFYESFPQTSDEEVIRLLK